jgi:hypothetical protein
MKTKAKLKRSETTPRLEAALEFLGIRVRVVNARPGDTVSELIITPAPGGRVAVQLGDPDTSLLEGDVRVYATHARR